MIINKKRVIVLKRYVGHISIGEVIRIKISRENISSKVKDYGINIDINDDYVPLPLSKLASENFEGSWKVRRDLPKESRIIEREYNMKGWHETWHSGISYEKRMCYPKEFSNPRNIRLHVVDQEIFSKEYVFGEDDEEIKFTINLLLEINGICEIIAKDAEFSFDGKNVEYVDWEIFPTGENPWGEIEEKLKGRIRGKTENYRKEIIDRHKTIGTKNFSKAYIGKKTFFGYVVFEFTDKNLFVLESDFLNNATYIFEDNWETLSKLTKAEIINGNLHKYRLIHGDGWKSRINSILD